MTLGQIAYEAYCATTDNKSLVSGATLPGWNDTNPKIRDAWNNAADAVRLEIASRIMREIK